MKVKPKTFFSTFAISVAMQAFTILQGILIARLLGPNGRGELAGIVLWPNIIASIGLFGINTSIARKAASTENPGELVTPTIFLSLTTALVTTFAAFLLIPGLVAEKNFYLLSLVNIYLLFITLNHISLNFTAIDQGTGNFTRMNLVRLLFYPIYLCLLILLWLTNSFTVKTVIFALLAGNAVVSSFVIMVWWKSIRFPIKAGNIKTIITGSWKFGSVNIVDHLYFYADQILLFTLLAPLDLGLYVVGSSAAALSGIFSDSNGIIAFTTAAQNRGFNDSSFISNVIRKSIIIWIAFSIVLVLTIPFLLPLIYGNDFSDSVPIAIILISGFGFLGIAKLIDQTFRGEGKPFLGMYGRILSLITFGILGYLFARIFGKEGIAFTFIIVQLVYLCFLLVIFKKNAGDFKLISLLPRKQDFLEVITLLKNIIDFLLSKFKKHRGFFNG
ncbi:MAG: hypothetical protein B6D44_16395 [Ignavibacteriales bacterium UTCHB2]|nr:MAG: hypothetical protein B6D44_16395 [Ignavibacteriales bacterium UTCHB2]